VIEGQIVLRALRLDGVLEEPKPLPARHAKAEIGWVGNGIGFAVDLAIDTTKTAETANQVAAKINPIVIMIHLRGTQRFRLYIL
jgi:hypothetical protein